MVSQLITTPWGEGAGHRLEQLLASGLGHRFNMTTLKWQALVKLNTYDMNAAWAYTWKKQETLSSRCTGWFLWGRCIPYIGQPPLAIFSLTGPEPFRFLKLKKTIPSKWRLFSPSMSNLGCAINFTERVTLKYWGKTRSNGGGGHFVKNNKK